MLPRECGASPAPSAEVDFCGCLCLFVGVVFGHVLPDCGEAEALVVAERLRSAIASCTDPVRVSASAGVATIPANAVDGA